MIVRSRIFINTILLQFLAITAICSQDCHCNVQQVLSNSVESCDLTIGEVIIVSNVEELRLAMIRVNAEGGNFTVLIKDGIYPIASTFWYPYITANNVVFRSLSGDRDAVVLTGTGNHSVEPGVEIGISVVGNNITIADLTIKNVGNHGISTRGDHMFVHNVKIQNTYEQMIKGTASGDGADNCVVQCSLFEYTENIGPQWYIGGLDIHKGNDWMVRDNIFRNIISPSQAVAEHAIHFWNFSGNNTIERNMIINCDRGIGFGLGESPNEGGIIRNNMIYNDGKGLFSDVGIGLESSPGTKVYSNSIIINYPNAIEYRFDQSIDIEIKNNLTNGNIKSRNGGSAEVEMNYTQAVDDWFENLYEGNLRLKDLDLPLVVDQGLDLSEFVFDDIDQTLRPMGNALDIGAHERNAISNIKEVKLSSNEIEVFPNPVVQSFRIQTKHSLIKEIRVFSISSGKEIFSKNANSASELIVNTEKWPKGIYLCKILDNEQKIYFTKITILND